MSRASLRLCVCVGWASLAACATSATKETLRSSAIRSAEGVLARLIGERAEQFRFAEISKEGGLDVFEVSALDGTVRVAGSNGVAMARGAYEYLKDACGCLVTWDGDQLHLPDRFPDSEAQRVVCPNRYRHDFNVCTFGYTSAFWNWDRWQREIDWMALHGINMPLAMNGEEKVWQTVWREFGISAEESRAFFTGPAFLPWHRMGNLDGHAGPLPQEWIDSQAELQKKILARERELGMAPVTPAFAGFVPKKFVELHPEARIAPAAAWCGFEPTLELDPRDPLFGAIEKRFLEEYIRLFGTDHLYIADLYNEMQPQVSKDDRIEELNAIARAVFDALHAGDPECTWVMQGWLFHNDAGFWGTDEVTSFLAGVADNRMIVLDLMCEENEIWRKQAAVRGKPWIWNLLHDFGQRTTLFGDLTLVAEKPIAALDDPAHGNMSGMGLTMEGTEQNAVVYELMLDTMWRNESIDVPEWLDRYATQRYGRDDESGHAIWSTLRRVIYSKESGVWDLAAYQMRPKRDAARKPTNAHTHDREIVEQMLAAPADIQASPLFRRDLVDVAKRFAAKEIDARIFAVIASIDTGDKDKTQRMRAEFDAWMNELDALLATVPQHRMDRWIAMARDSVTSAEDKALFERNARLQVTVWGGPELADYAAKEWSGLVAEFYRPRWDRFFDALSLGPLDAKKLAQESAAWELAWCDRNDLPKPRHVDPIAQTRRLLALADR